MDDENTLNFAIFPPVEALSKDVEHFRIIHYSGSEANSVKVCPNGMPGIIYEFGSGSIRSIVSDSNRVVKRIPAFYLYGQVKQPSVMHYDGGPYTTVQMVLKPYAIKSLFGIDATAVTDGYMKCHEFGAEELYSALKKANNSKECIALMTDFLLQQLQESHPRDILVEHSLQFIHDKISTVDLNALLNEVHLSERQFQKRFVRTVGVSPQFYIRVKRFNEAIRLIDTGQYMRLSEVAQALHFYDQSHFIRDIKQFSGITPKSIFQKTNHFHHDMIGSSYLV